MSANWTLLDHVSLFILAHKEVDDERKLDAA